MNSHILIKNDFYFYFQSQRQDFWCARPNNLKDIDVNIWKKLTQPVDACTIINYDYTNFTASNLTAQIEALGTHPTIQCHQFEFDHSLFGNTIIAEWNLVCDRAYLPSFVEMCFLTGAALGSVFSGWISDRFGRKHTLMWSAIIQAICGE